MRTKHTYPFCSLPIIGGGNLLNINKLQKLILVFFVLISTGVSLSSCEREMLPDPMLDMYQESRKLTETSADSVISFTLKFKRYVNANPGSVESDYYNPILENLLISRITFHLTNGSWDEDIHWDFGFGEGDSDGNSNTRSTGTDSVSGGVVQIGDITINTEWEGETFINF